MNKYFHWASILLFFAVFISVFFPSWLSLIHRWNKFDGSYAHGYLVVGISIYYLVQKVLSIEPGKIKANYSVAPLLLAGSLVWTLSYYANLEVIHQILLPIMLGLFFMLALGLKEGKSFLFPFLFLCFAIPFWDYLTIPLQALTVHANNFLLTLIGIPAFIDGFYVTIPAGNFEIAGGCSGLRYLNVALFLSVLYSYQNYSRWRTKALLIFTGIFLALITNWLRIFIIIVAGNVTNMETSLIHEHDTFGWVLFGVALIAFFYLAHHYSSWLDDDLPITESVQGEWQHYSAMPYVLAFLVTFSLPLLISPVNSDMVEEVSLPAFSGEVLPGYKLLINPVFIGSDSSRDEVFKVGDNVLQVSVRSFSEQKPGKELVAYGNYVFSDSWQQVNEITENDFSFMELKHRETEQTILVGKQYSVSGYRVSNRIVAKLLEIFKPVMSSPQSSILVLASPCSGSCNAAKDKMKKFLLKNEVQIGRL